MKLRNLCLGLLLLLAGPLLGQSTTERLQRLQVQLNALQREQVKVEEKIELLRLEQLSEDLGDYLPALRPSETLVEHRLLKLVYSEADEQARWVAHAISPAIIDGSVARTNDFRPDPKVSSGSAVEEDYFLKTLQPDSSYAYDGYGYDRGHLAPSADFRWSKVALSESYLYSNMSPQLPEFNRGIWAELENAIRGYVYRHPDHTLFVVTGPLLGPERRRSERSINQLTVPDAFWKVVYDPATQRGVGFLLPHKGSRAPLVSFLTTIDAIEALTGIDFFHQLEDGLEKRIEAEVDKQAWLGKEAAAETKPLDPTTLPRNHFNTLQAERYMRQQEEVHVCGTVVSSRLSRNGNLLMNLDRAYPNQIFTVFVRKEHLINFPYDPLQQLQNKAICAEGQVVNLGGTPAMFIEDSNRIREQ